jgi:hypothetical protein
MALMNKDDILSQDDREFKDVFVPQWAGTVRLKGLSAKGKDVLTLKTGEMRDGDCDINFRALLVSLCAVDKEGNRLFSSGDIEALGEKNSDAMETLYEAAGKLSGLLDESEQEAVEAFDDAQDDDLSSD